MDNIVISIDKLKRIEGKQTIESVSEILNIKKNTALNLISMLRKHNLATRNGGGKQKRIYTISTKILRTKEFEGMFDILNKYSPEKIIHSFVHEPHSKYCIENAIIDLIDLNDLRIIINSLSLFNHVKNWSMLYDLAKKKGARRMVGALYDVAKQATRVRRMPKRIKNLLLKSPKEKGFQTTSHSFQDIEKKWHINIPFNKKDLEVYKR